jgi:hypothetical protein
VGTAIDKQREIRMAVDVDEAGSHHKAPRIDDSRGRRCGQVANGFDSRRRHSDIPAATRATGTVDDIAASDQDVERRQAGTSLADNSLMEAR